MMTTPEHRGLHAIALGRTEYRLCWELQQRTAARRLSGAVGDTLLITEHHPVYTIGRTGDADHVLAGDEELRRRGIDLVAVERGGDVTYHGPGQLVAYPILDLHGIYLDLHRYLRDLEEAVIRLLARFGVHGERHPSYTGVWVEGDKICAIGIHVKRWVTMHGLALNVRGDLSPFGRIIPCGIFEKGVTSLERCRDAAPALEEVGAAFIEEFAGVFGYHVDVAVGGPGDEPGGTSGLPPSGPAGSAGAFRGAIGADRASFDRRT